MANLNRYISTYFWFYFCLVFQTSSNSRFHYQAPLSGPSPGTIGCGLLPPSSPGHSENFTFYSEHGGGQRAYLVHLPLNYKLTDPHPLILSFHGFTQTMHHQEHISKFSNSTTNPNAITVYPQGLGSPPAWQGAPYSLEGVDDLAFTNDLVTHLKAHYCIDEGKLFATGMSNGGGFVNTLACSSEGQAFAAFAAVAGAFYGDVAEEKFECEPAWLPVPILEIHGDKDGIIAYQGGEASGVAIPAIPGWLHRWAVRNGCPGSSVGKVRDIIDRNVQETAYDCNGIQKVVTGLKVKGMGHVWPSVTSNDDNGNVTTWMDAAPHILLFFQGYRQF